MSGQDKRSRAEERPDYTVLARALLPKIRESAGDPEFIKRYQEWKEGREAERR